MKKKSKSSGAEKRRKAVRKAAGCSANSKRNMATPMNPTRPPQQDFEQTEKANKMLIEHSIKLMEKAKELGVHKVQVGVINFEMMPPLQPAPVFMNPSPLPAELGQERIDPLDREITDEELATYSS